MMIKQRKKLKSEYQKILTETKNTFKLLSFSKSVLNYDADEVLGLEKYLKLGDDLINAPETQNFIELINSISNSRSPFKKINNPGDLYAIQKLPNCLLFLFVLLQGLVKHNCHFL